MNEADPIPPELNEIPSMLSMTDAMASPSDLEMELTEEEEELVTSFENGWRDFLRNQPHMIPKGRRGYQLEALTRDVKDMGEAKKAAEIELQNQLDFFTTSRDRLETVYQHEMEVAVQRQKEVQDRIQQKLDTVTISEQIMSQTIPWNGFLEAVDNAADQLDLASRNARAKMAFKPSIRAMALVDREGDEEDVRLRAFRMDHALLTAQVQMLAREVERYEKTNESLDLVAKFFTEHNIWGILTKQQAEVGSVPSSDPPPSPSVSRQSPMPSPKTSRPSTPIDP